MVYSQDQEVCYVNRLKQFINKIKDRKKYKQLNAFPPIVFGELIPSEKINVNLKMMENKRMCEALYCRKFNNNVAEYRIFHRRDRSKNYNVCVNCLVKLVDETGITQSSTPIYYKGLK